MSEYGKPLPELEGLHGEFFDFCKQGELRFQRCDDCSSWRHVPREICPECGSWNWQWQVSSGRGKIFTWTTMARPLHPAFKDACPLAAVVVELDEGVRLLSHVVNCPPDELAIDMPVHVIFDAVTPEVTLPKFQRST
jgi:uncharacterized OB-fold protein